MPEHKRSVMPPGKIFSPDQPIHRTKEDKLGRKDFAKHMADAIRGWKGNDSLCLALYGEWGSGKTSIKNMIVDALQKPTTKAPLVVEFNPWQWSGQEQLISAFFTEIGAKLGQSDTSKEGKERASLFRNYGTALTFGSVAIKGIRIATSLFTGPASEMLFEPMQRGVDALKDGAEAAEKASIEEIVPLDERKKVLSQSLQALKRPILVIVDDIDRLVDDEIRLLFRLVKSNADFPNVIYLLLFHRDHVERALLGGRSYMEKIIQVGFEIPKVESKKLKELLEIELHSILKATSMIELFESQHSRWDAIYRSGASHFLGTMRDIKRFTSNLGFYLNMFRNGARPEINPVDLAAIQILAIFEPGVYHRVHTSKGPLTTDYHHSSTDEGRAEKSDLLLNHITAPAGEDNRSPLDNILKELFPILNVGHLGMINSTETNDSILRNLRICDRIFFDRYFHLDIQNDDISQNELLALFELAHDRERLVRSLLEFIDRGFWDVLFDRMQAHLDYLRDSDIESFIASLCDVGEKIVWADREKPSLSMREERLAQLAGILLVTRECNEAIRNACENSEGILIPLHIALDTFSKSSKPEFAMGLLQSSIHKVRAAAKSGTLYDHPRLAFLLRNWQWHNSGAEDAKEWVGRAIVPAKKGTFFHVLDLC
jgi:predicted KAP-like P-loop ATPase